MPESGRTLSLWQDEFQAPATVPLQDDAVCDVCVIGAGIAGLTTAYVLAREKFKVIVLEDGEIGGGATLRTTAHLTSGLDDRYYNLENWHGRQGAVLAAQSHSMAIDTIESICRSESIDCDFRRVEGYLVAGKQDERSLDELERECAAALRAGLDTTMTRVPIASYDFGPAVLFPRQGQFHAGRYLAGLARAVARAATPIYTGTRASEVTGGSSPCVVTAAGQVVRCSAVVVATNTPFNDRVVIHTKQAAYRTYVIATRVRREALPAWLLWDTLDPYHYVRTQPADAGYDWLIVGGEDHKTGQEEHAGPFERLLAWTRERFPSAGEPGYHWSGQVIESQDGLAFIGPNPGDKNVYIVTGDSGNGMTHGTIAGLLLTDLIAGRQNAWATLYDPSRTTLGVADTFVRENANVAAQYRDHLMPGDINGPGDLGNGEGAIIRRGAARHALYRDPSGALHEMSAICPHLGCDVRWNTTEKTWDCPCHGSRFAAADGHVLNGPANSGLTSVKS